MKMSEGVEVGENEWITSTNEQIGMLRKLVDRLICTARMDEEASLYGEKQLLDMSELVMDAVTCFAPMAMKDGRQMELDIPERAQMMGNEELLRRMLSVLCDNAVRHAEGEGDIALALAVKPKAIVLRVKIPGLPQKTARFMRRCSIAFIRPILPAARMVCTTALASACPLRRKRRNGTEALLKRRRMGKTASASL